MSEFARTTFTNYPNSTGLSKIGTGGVLARDAFFGTVSAATIYEHASEGTLELSGSAQVAHVSILTSTGTLNITGSSAVDNPAAYEHASDGTLSLSGSTSVANIFNIESAGTVNITGESTVLNPDVSEYESTGTLTLAGSTAISNEFAQASSGEIDLEAYSLVRNIITSAHNSSGTIQLSGTSLIEVSGITEINSIGTIELSGYADFEFINVIPEVKQSGSTRHYKTERIKFDLEAYKKRLEALFKQEQEEKRKPTIYEFESEGVFMDASGEGLVAHEIIFKSSGHIDFTINSIDEFEDTYAFIRKGEEDFILNIL